MSAEPIETGRMGEDADAVDAADREERRRLEGTWKYARGLWGWLTEVSHTRIGKRYIVTALVFFALGGLVKFRRPVSQDGRLKGDEHQSHQPRQNPHDRQAIEDEPGHQRVSDGAPRIFPHVFLGLLEHLFELFLCVTQAALGHIAGSF